MGNSDLALWRELTFEEADGILHRDCNSYTRLSSLIAMQFEVDSNDWLRLLGEWWTSCDDISERARDEEDFSLWQSPFEWLAERPLDLRHLMMTQEELAALEALPPVLTIFRGCYAINKRGLSWSLDRSVAEGFPFKHRYTQEGQPLLVRAEVARDDVLMLKLDREEQEIVVPPWKPKIRAIRHARAMAEG